MAPQIVRLCVIGLATISGTFAAAIENVEVAGRDYVPPPPPPPTYYTPPPPPSYGPKTSCVPSYIISYATNVASVPVTKTYTALSTNTAYSYATHVATVPVVKTYTVLSTSTGYDYSTSVATIPVVKTVTNLATSTTLSATTSVKTVSVKTSACSTIKVPVYTPPPTYY